MGCYRDTIDCNICITKIDLYRIFTFYRYIGSIIFANIFTVHFCVLLLRWLDIWSTVVTRGVWKDIADCGERQLGVEHEEAGGNQVL